MYAAEHDGVCTRIFKCLLGIFQRLDIAVDDKRDGYNITNCTDCVPVRPALIELAARAAVHGNDVNARSLDTEVKKEFPGNAGYPALHSAAFGGNFDIVDLLRAHGARGPIVEPVSDLLATASSSEGERIYNASCNDCHSIDKGGLSGSKTNLWGVLGRKKAGIDGVGYSKAFAQLQGTWSLAEFNAFIASPVDYVPGTKMRFNGFKEPATRANLIAYLRTMSDNPPPLPPSVPAKK